MPASIYSSRLAPPTSPNPIQQPETDRQRQASHRKNSHTHTPSRPITETLHGRLRYSGTLVSLPLAQNVTIPKRQTPKRQTCKTSSLRKAFGSRSGRPWLDQTLTARPIRNVAPTKMNAHRETGSESPSSRTSAKPTGPPNPPNHQEQGHPKDTPKKANGKVKRTGQQHGLVL